MADKNYTDVLLEDISDKFDIVLDGIKGMREEMTGLARQKDLEEVKQEVKTIKHVLTDTNEQLADHKKRITHLEAKV